MNPIVLGRQLGRPPGFAQRLLAGVGMKQDPGPNRTSRRIFGSQGHELVRNSKRPNVIARIKGSTCPGHQLVKLRFAHGRSSRRNSPGTVLWASSYPANRTASSRGAGDGAGCVVWKSFEHGKLDEGRSKHSLNPSVTSLVYDRKVSRNRARVLLHALKPEISPSPDGQGELEIPVCQRNWLAGHAVEDRAGTGEAEGFPVGTQGCESFLSAEV